LGTLAIDDGVALVAFLADAFLAIELFAGSLDFAADSIFIEEESLGALKAGVSAPNFAAEIVVKLCEECGIV
jgi:hypothetical protein